MNRPENKIRIAVTGPESTGKTTLAKQLAESFNGHYVPEYAREYIEELTGHYTFEDVETVAKAQVNQYMDSSKYPEKFIFFDTWLIITKVWFLWVFKIAPAWLEDEIQNCQIDLFLLCQPDLPWQADPVRENGGENRLKLYELYRDELEHYGFNFVEIDGTGDNRLSNSKEAISDFFGLTQTFGQ
jgi:NadR type nicotinamide-nucleotide adenylyltransferase